MSKLSVAVVPLSSTKVLHLIRHAEGYHNVAGAIDYSNYRSEDYKDAHLTKLGYEQAHDLARKIKSKGLKVDLVVCSIMSRALETAVIAFGNHALEDGPGHSANGSVVNGSSSSSNGSGSGGKAKLLMVERSAQHGIVTPHPSVSADGSPPFLALEVCREHLGVHPCDARRPTSFYRKTFPAVDFSLIEEEEDVLWEADVREPDSGVSARGVKFLEWVLQRPESNIAVVAHSGFLGHMLSNFGQGLPPDAQDELHRPFANAELREVVLHPTARSSQIPVVNVAGEKQGATPAVVVA